MYLELFLFSHSRIQYGVDHHAVPHEQLGIDSAALALAHREYYLDQSIAKWHRINQRHEISFYQIVVGLICRGRTLAFTPNIVFRYYPLVCVSKFVGRVQSRMRSGLHTRGSVMI